MTDSPTVRGVLYRGFLRRAVAQGIVKRLRDGESFDFASSDARVFTIGGLKTKPDPHEALHRAIKVSKS